MRTYTKIRDHVDHKIKKFTENPEQLFEKIKLADVIVVIGGLMLLGFTLNIVSSIINFILLWASPTKTVIGL